MKPEDEARLEVIRADWRAVYSAANADYGLFLRIIDEQAAEIARLEAQLAEERAKLRCQEERFMWRHAAEKERADMAGRELAEERAKKCDYRAEYEAEYSKRTVAEARVKELETQLRQDQRDAIISWFDENKDAAVKQIGDLNGVLEKERDEAVARVAELQALVDAATRFEYGSYGAELDLGDNWTVLYQDPERSARSPVWVAVSCYHERDEAIALARDLAAKEKEPTR